MMYLLARMCTPQFHEEFFFFLLQVLMVILFSSEFPLLRMVLYSENKCNVVWTFVSEPDPYLCFCVFFYKILLFFACGQDFPLLFLKNDWDFQHFLVRL